MDVRKKLVEIVCDVMESDGCIGHCNHSPCFEVERVVNALIDNGVTVQENMEISDELLKQLKNAPITTWKEEPSIETVQEWISVKDRLPEDDSDVLAYSRIGEESRIYPACYSNGVWFDCVFNAPATDTTTHWMPMPNPPKGE